MSLFKCEECGVVENTALCGFVIERADTGKIVKFNTLEYHQAKLDGIEIRRKLICSQCNPEVGKWHGVFKRQDADAHGYTQIEGSRYIQGPSPS